jgi:REP element-mobilizing transposase RayT
MPGRPPLAYFITFRCYGTWLHGDTRGSIDPEHRNYGEEPLRRDDLRVAFERREMSGRPATLDADRRHAVHAALADVCAFRSWALLALNVRTNHVHLVVAADLAPELVMNRLKARSTRALREAGMLAPDERVWSRHGSTKYLWKEEDVEQACVYVMEGQDKPGE